MQRSAACHHTLKRSREKGQDVSWNWDSPPSLHLHAALSQLFSAQLSVRKTLSWHNQAVIALVSGGWALVMFCFGIFQLFSFLFLSSLEHLLPSIIWKLLFSVGAGKLLAFYQIISSTNEVVWKLLSEIKVLTFTFRKVGMMMVKCLRLQQSWYF